VQDSRPASPAPLPRAILFDCDGTLLLTSDLHFKAISQAVERQAAQMPRDWYMALTGLGRRDLFAAFMRDFGIGLDLARAIADSIATTVAMAAEARENPAVADIARRVSGRLPTAVVTNSETAIVNALLHQTGLLGLFDAILGCESATHPKPAPDLYLAAAARLGVAPGDCLVFEDSDQGILAARKAGMRCIDVRTPDWSGQCGDLEGRLLQRG
jgi:beta-phosphoglucomutase-like phosphatase (HAD superfamily)